jgi:holo-[acyl-carrier protein] synthase
LGVCESKAACQYPKPLLDHTLIRVDSMIFGIGTDIIEVKRVGEMVARGRQYLETIFTEKEMDYCEAKARKSEHYAARYAAKEAILKALGTGWRGGLAYSDIEITNEESGKPQVFVRGKVKIFFDSQKIRRTSISLSHTKEIAIAFIILEN